MGESGLTVSLVGNLKEDFPPLVPSYHQNYRFAYLDTHPADLLFVVGHYKVRHLRHMRDLG